VTTGDNPRSDTPADPGGVPAFFTDPDFDFEFRTALGATAHGVGDPGMWLATAARIVDGDRPSWFAAWSERADQLSALGDAAAASGDARGAGWAYLSASAAYSRALGAVDGLPPDQADAVMLPTFRSSRRCWDAMIDSSEGRFVRVEVPYSDTTLPGYLLRPDASGSTRPTYVMTNGSDGALSSLWASGAAEALAHGWNAFVYDGPGQQSMLFERDIPFRPDWEAVLMEQAGGDPATARTFAFRARPYGIDDPYDLFGAVRSYQLRDVAGQIRTPLLITDPQDEQFWPGQSDQLAGLLVAPHEVQPFTREDGANYHCQPLASRLTAYRIFDWLTRQLGSSASS
jgi:hypothetical protein